MIQDEITGREKIIFAVTAGILIIGMLLCAILSARSREAVDERIARIERDTECAWASAEEAEGRAVVLPAVPEAAIPLSGRDIFSRGPATVQKGAEPGISPEPRFEILDIMPKPLGISYEGRVVFTDGRVVAQVNVGKESYLVGAGATLASYTVADLNKNKLILLSGEARYVVNYREPAYSDELVATVRDLNSAKTFSVEKNSDFLGGTVLDIDEESVLVSNQGQYLRLEKGTVYP